MAHQRRFAGKVFPAFRAFDSIWQEIVEFVHFFETLGQADFRMQFELEMFAQLFHAAEGFACREKREARALIYLIHLSNYLII